MNNDPIFNMSMCLICINDDLRNNSNITITQKLRHGLFENFSPFILFFWLALWTYDYLISNAVKYLLLKSFND